MMDDGGDPSSEALCVLVACEMNVFRASGSFQTSARGKFFGTPAETSKQVRIHPAGQLRREVVVVLATWLGRRQQECGGTYDTHHHPKHTRTTYNTHAQNTKYVTHTQHTQTKQTHKPQTQQTHKHNKHTALKGDNALVHRGMQVEVDGVGVLHRRPLP